MVHQIILSQLSFHVASNKVSKYDKLFGKRGRSVSIDVSSFESALGQLETSLQYLHGTQDAGLRIQFRNSAIQCFEFTYELCFKMVRRFLRQTVSVPDELNQMNFADFARTAADAGLLPDVKRFLRYRERRNLTSHTYNESRANEVILILDDFVKDMKVILVEMKKRNEL